MPGLLSKDDQGQLQVLLPRVSLALVPTPLEAQPHMGRKLGVALSVKRDDLTGLAFGGNKIRQLEYYFGQAREQGATAVLVSGAIQSNYTRATAAVAARLGLRCHVQLENRVPSMRSEAYARSGNVLLSDIYGASVSHFDDPDDEVGADAAIHGIAQGLRERGEVPYVISLKADSDPLGSVGYLHAAAELLSQQPDVSHVVLASGSGQTQAGLLFGLRFLGSAARVLGVSVRRDVPAQRQRVLSHCAALARMLDVPPVTTAQDVEVFDGNPDTSYGLPDARLLDFLLDVARSDGLLLDPVYTGKAFAGMARLREQGHLPAGARVVFVHTGGMPALFAYGPEFQSRAAARHQG